MFEKNLTEEINYFIEKVPGVRFETFMLPESWWKSRGFGKKRYKSLVITIPDFKLPSHWWTRFIDIRMVVNPGFFTSYHSGLYFWLSSIPQINGYDFDYKTRTLIRNQKPTNLGNIHFPEHDIEGYSLVSPLYGKTKLYSVFIKPETYGYVPLNSSVLRLYYRWVLTFFDKMGSNEEILKLYNVDD